MNRRTNNHPLLLNYVALQKRFLSYKARLKTFWPDVVVERKSYAFPEEESSEQKDNAILLSSDMIWARHTSDPSTTQAPHTPPSTADALKGPHAKRSQTHNTFLLVLSAGLHGVEGYVGAHLIDHYVRSYYDETQRHKHHGSPPPFDLALIHGINPWGMLNMRKANARNVDLNRNFVIDWRDRNTLNNPDYDALKDLLHPSHAHPSKAYFYGQLLRTLLRLRQRAPRQIERALTLGQFNDPEGPYYGGTTYEPETMWMMRIIEKLFSCYRSIIWLDLHTGYGPRGLMQVVRASGDMHTRKAWQSYFSYPYVVETAGENFYAIHGDMIEYMYAYQKKQHPHLELYAATLEFGTLGDTLWALIQSLATTVLENASYHAGRKTRQHERQLLEMYAPSDTRWLNQSMQQFLRFMHHVHDRLQNAYL